MCILPVQRGCKLQFAVSVRVKLYQSSISSHRPGDFRDVHRAKVLRDVWHDQLAELEVGSTLREVKDVVVGLEGRGQIAKEEKHTLTACGMGKIETGGN